MWGFGGRYYWGRRESGYGGRREGIVVVFAWMSSQDRHLNNYVKLYSSLGWDSLICHSQFLNMFFPDKAAALASELLNELIEDLKIRPSPVVFASFSGGPKACMYKVLQIIEGRCDTQVDLDECQLVKDCISGHIFDSSPVDFTCDLGTRFAIHPSVLKMSQPPKVVSWIASGIGSSLDALFLSRFESQRAEYWQTLYASVSMGAPYLIICSENDDLAPYQVICNFAQKMQEFGGDVKLLTWSRSSHVGHYRHYPVDYKAAITELLGKAATIYSRKTQRLLDGEKASLEGGAHDEISEPLNNLRQAAVGPTQSFQGTPLMATDHFLVPTSMAYYEGRDVGSVRDEHKEGFIRLPSPQSISPHGVLGQILFDVCLPKTIEDWDIRSSSSSHRHSYVSSRRPASFNPIKCIRRTRL
jgi:farnesol dehydrogenase